MNPLRRTAPLINVVWGVASSERSHPPIFLDALEWMEQGRDMAAQTRDYDYDMIWIIIMNDMA